MKSSLFLIFILIFPLFFLAGCEETDTPDDCGCINNIDTSNLSRHLTFTFSIAGEGYGYISLDKIDSVKIFIDGIPYQPVCSENIDTIGQTVYIYNNIPYSQSKRKYLVKFPEKPDTSSIQTVSEYISYLENLPVLEAGDHILEIAEINFRNKKNEWVYFKPQVYMGFSVPENIKEIYVGDFELLFTDNN